MNFCGAVLIHGILVDSDKLPWYPDYDDPELWWKETHNEESFPLGWLEINENTTLISAGRQVYAPVGCPKMIGVGDIVLSGYDLRRLECFVDEHKIEGAGIPRLYLVSVQF